MTKEQFLNKWHFTGHNLILKDLEAVIAHEIANVQEAKLKHADQVIDQEPDQVAEPAEQPSSQAKLDNSFDKDRFERMFCSMVAREPHWTYKDCMIETEKLLTQLDSFYFEKTSK